MRRCSFGLILAICFNICNAQTPFDKLSVIIQQNTSSTSNLMTDFVQEKTSPMLEEAVKSSGKLYFAKPKHIRWEYKGEKASIIIFNEDKAYLVSNGKKKEYNLAKNPLFSKVNEIIAMSVNGNVLARKEFAATVTESKGNYNVLLKPKVNALRLFLKEVNLSVSEKGDVESLIITGKSGDETKIRFFNSVKNGKMDGKLFEL